MCKIQALGPDVIEVICLDERREIQDGDRFCFTESHGPYSKGEVIEVRVNIDWDGEIFEPRGYFLQVWPITDKSEQLKDTEWICLVFCENKVEKV